MTGEYLTGSLSGIVFDPEKRAVLQAVDMSEVLSDSAVEADTEQAGPGCDDPGKHV
jgi:hypothetical protein